MQVHLLIYRYTVHDFWRLIILYILKSSVHSHTLFYGINHATQTSNYKPPYRIQFRGREIAEHTLQSEFLVLFHPTLDKFSKFWKYCSMLWMMNEMKNLHSVHSE